MSLLLKIGRTWHPLARLNLFIVIVFTIFLLSTVIGVWFSPSAINTKTVSIVLAVGWAWWLTAVPCTIWAFWNALSISWETRRYTIDSRNILSTWLLAMLMLIYIPGWSFLLNQVTNLRLERDFEASRSDFLIICERVLAEGVDSPNIQDGVELGVFKDVNILYANNAVYFEVGDDLRAYGFVCVGEDQELPAKDELYEYTRLDDRFYAFGEIENRLTPQPDTPTPELTPEENS